MSAKDKLRIGDKVTFDAFNHDEEKDMFGRGWVKEIDTDNDQIIIQTTRKLIWVQTDGVSLVKQGKKN